MFWKITVIDIEEYTKLFQRKIVNIKDNFYLYYIRYKIYCAKEPDDLINLLQYISDTTNNTDDILNLLTNCFIKYPLSDIELQKMSQWQQIYDSELGIYSYTTITLWLSIINAIQERESIKLIK